MPVSKPPTERDDPQRKTIRVAPPSRRRPALAMVAAMVGGLILASGCRPESPTKSPSTAAPNGAATALPLDGPPPPARPWDQALAALTPRQSAITARLVDERCGSLTAPLVPPFSATTAARLAAGAQTFAARCARCHGREGDGRGPEAAELRPAPRDFRRGIFKWTSTSAMSKPLVDDLRRTIRAGIPGAAMPAHADLADEQLADAAEYVRALSRRGDFASQLGLTVDDWLSAAGEIDNAAVADTLAAIDKFWSDAPGQVVTPATAEPAASAATIAAGERVYFELACNVCHGPLGKGGTPVPLTPDSWGRPTIVPDLTRGEFRGGSSSLDLYRRVDAGINGTPMGSYHTVLSNRAADTWPLVHFLQNLPRK